jgi:hypothetical protein
MSAPIITFSNNAGPVFHFINKNEKTKMADKYLQLVSEVIDYLADEGFIVKDGNKVKESIRFEEATFVVDKVKRAKKDKVVKIPIPFDSNNVKFDDGKLIGCNCLMKNHGLYTQCNRIPKNGSETCSTCNALNIKNDGKPIYGTVQERLQSDFHKSDLVHYTVVMKKLKIEWNQVVEEAEKLGLVLDPSHSIEPENSINTVAKKGRPKKVTVPNVETVSNVDTVYPIATVVATQKENKTTNKKENTKPNNKKEKKTKKVEVVQPIIEEFDSDNDIDIDSDIDIDNDIDSADIDNVEEEEEEEEEEEVVVEKFVYGKKQLLKDLNNNIYDLDNVKIGVYDPVTKKVKYDLKKN